jgi:hypothetical protein
MSSWRRLSQAAEPEDAFKAIAAGAEWVFFWCGGGTTRSTASEAERRRALAYARAETAGPAAIRRLAEKAAHKGRSRTIVLAEAWSEEAGGQMVVFYEGSPYFLPDRPFPDKL